MSKGAYMQSKNILLLQWDVVPDIITMAKGVTSAYLPLGVVAMSPEIAKSFDENVFYGGLTYSGHPLCLAAGNRLIWYHCK